MGDLGIACVSEKETEHFPKGATGNNSKICGEMQVTNYSIESNIV